MASVTHKSRTQTKKKWNDISFHFLLMLLYDTICLCVPDKDTVSRKKEKSRNLFLIKFERGSRLCYLVCRSPSAHYQVAPWSLASPVLCCPHTSSGQWSRGTAGIRQTFKKERNLRVSHRAIRQSYIRLPVGGDNVHLRHTGGRRRRHLGLLRSARCLCAAHTGSSADSSVLLASRENKSIVSSLLIALAISLFCNTDGYSHSDALFSAYVNQA